MLPGFMMKPFIYISFFTSVLSSLEMSLFEIELKKTRFYSPFLKSLSIDFLISPYSII